MKIGVSFWTWFKCDYTNHRLNVDGEERCRRTQVGPVGDKIGSPCPPLTKMSPVESWVRLTRAYAAQGGVTLGPEQGELGPNFCYLGGVDVSRPIRGQLPVPNAFGRTIRQRTLRSLRNLPEFSPPNSLIFLLSRSRPKARCDQALVCRSHPNETSALFPHLML
jgi:hypothetical protein